MAFILTTLLNEDPINAWLNTLGSGIGVQLGGYNKFGNYYDFDSTNDKIEINTLFGGVNVGLLHGIIEGLTKRKFLGKYLLGLMVVNKNGKPINFIVSILRNLLRLIPFSIFSYKGNNPKGFHNLICKTKVIDINFGYGKIAFFNNKIFTNSSIINNTEVLNFKELALFKKSASFDKVNINSLKELHELKKKGVITE